MNTQPTPNTPQPPETHHPFNPPPSPTHTSFNSTTALAFKIYQLQMSQPDCDYAPYPVLA